jgi:cation transport ATPase
MKFALLSLICLLPASAQLRSVEIRVSGLDCASCAESVDRKLGRMRGVESASFDASKNIAIIKLKPENTVTLPGIRDTLKSMGYTPEEAKVSVAGELRDGVLSMKHQERAFTVDGSRETGAVVVEGTVAAGGDRLTPGTVRPQ